MQKNLAENIRALRKSKGYTLKKLSDIIGVGEMTVSNYENGLREPNIDRLIKLADIFEVNIDTLIRGRILDKTDFDCSENANGIKYGGVVVGHIPHEQVADFKAILPRLNSLLNSAFLAENKNTSDN